MSDRIQNSTQISERKTALVLSGGGSRGAYQCGVWQALTELGIKIDIVVGVSVGAVNGVMVVQGDAVKTAGLWREMETDMVFDVEEGAQLQDFAKAFFVSQGAGSTGMQALLSEYVDEDAVRKSPVDFGLVTVEVPSMRAHYLWKEDIPKGQLCDYITASASAFPAVHAAEIDGRYFIDGGYEDNLPVTMALEKGATEVIAVYLDAVGRFKPSELKEVPNLTFIESKWNLGDFLVFDIANAKRILRLGYLDAMKTYGIYDGFYYTFAKDIFDKRTLKQADHAARIFKLDPLILYRRDYFEEELKKAVEKTKSERGGSFEIPDLTSLSKIKELMKLAEKTGITLYIAESLRQKGQESFFLTRYVSRLLREEVSAAKLLVKWNLV